MTNTSWQPIETAPKDGAPILSWDGSQCAVIAYCGCKKTWHLLEGDNEPHESCPTPWKGVTHWIALPAPPGEPIPFFGGAV